MLQEYEDKRRKDGFFTKVRSDLNSDIIIIITIIIIIIIITIIK